jgi:hypothetical protein
VRKTRQYADLQAGKEGDQGRQIYNRVFEIVPGKRKIILP